MYKYLILAIVTGVLLGLGGYLINRYGKVNFTLGSTTVEYRQLVETTKRVKEITSYIEEQQNEVKSLSEDELNSVLLNLGIMHNYPTSR